MKKKWVKATKHTPQRVKCALTDHFVYRMVIPLIFVYRKSIPVEQIITALQQVLADFPVFAGRLVKKTGQLYIDCDNTGVPVTQVQVADYLFSKDPIDLQQVGSSRFIDRLYPMMWFRQGCPVFTIKLSYYLDGMVMGCCGAHAVGDVLSIMTFLHALSACLNGQHYSMPVIARDREAHLAQYLERTRCEGKTPFIFLKLGDILRLIKTLLMPKQAIYLHFTQAEVEALKQQMREKTGKPLSRNDVICAHLLHTIMTARQARVNIHHASVVLSLRQRIGMLPQVLGNYLDLVSMHYPSQQSVESLAESIHHAVHAHLQESFAYHKTAQFIEQCGGLRKIWRVVPHACLPTLKPVILTNWSHVGGYAIDLGGGPPCLFLPICQPLMVPWAVCIVDGIENQGLCALLVLPKHVL